MIRNANLNICIDQETKAAAEQLFTTLGLTIDDAISIFLHQALLVGGIPFDVRIPQYNAETEAAIQEARDIMSGQIQAKV
ncbi:MAG: type II toxin-antitoxin system RelB/DinJ family antitoxin, partial [Oscillospiraceae bacterium]|nr:type II toxin-antitoxin system RelB/DinJ family antitoxin [Oscillospiraceae bacterium]